MMRQKTLWAAAICMTFLSISSGRATSFPMGSEMLEGRVASTPYGFKKLCQTEKQHCALYRKAGSEPHAPLSMRSEHWDELKATNRAVNKEIKPLPEFTMFFRRDEWKISASIGDCEDYALMKQARLIAQGWPKDALLVTVAELPGGQRHAVLAVRTAQGDLILDNTTDKIKNWQDTDYRWIKRQSARNMMRWVEIKPVSQKKILPAKVRQTLLASLKI